MSAMDAKSKERFQWKVMAPDGTVLVFDFSRYQKIDQSILGELVEALRGIGGRWVFSTRKTNRRYFQDLLEFLEIFEWIETPKLLHKFKNWAESNKGRDRARMALSLAIKMVEWLADSEGSIWMKVEIPRIERKPRPKTNKSRTHLGENAVRQIVDACRKEIDEMMNRFELAKNLISNSYIPKNQEEDFLKERILTLLKAGNGYLPTRVQAIALGGRSIKSGFGIRDLKTYLYPSFRELLPFYVLLIYETAGNPISILWMRTDCLVPSPIDAEKVSINYKKERAGQIQRKWFNARKEYAPPEIVRKLILITSLSREHSKGFSDFLFVTVGGSRDVVKVPDYGTVHNVLKQFIEKNKLPNFDPRDFRYFVADKLLTKHKDPALVQAALQHQSIRTTRRYVDRNNLAKEVATVIAAGQAKLVSKLSIEWVSRSTETNNKRNKRMETVFGFSCNDPMAGMAPGSRRGIACDQFGRCGSCNNAIILIDSAEHVARILQAKDALRLAEQVARIDMEKMLRFKALYARTLQVIEQVIVPQVPRPVLSRAIQLISRMPPLLEIDL